MTGWQLVTLLAALFNTAAILYWQHANERRMDAHWERLQALQSQTKDLLPVMKQCIAHLLEWERWRDSEWLAIMEHAAAILAVPEGSHPALLELRRLKADRLRQSFFLAGRCAECASLVNLATTRHCMKCGVMFPTEMPKIGEESLVAKDPGCPPA